MNSFSALIIEDHSLVREAMMLSIGSLDCHPKVHGVGSVEQGLGVLGKHDIDLIILDLMLPEINGYSACSIFTEKFNWIPILIVTGLDGEDSEKRAFQAGASGFVSKASPNSTLLQAVFTVLSGGTFCPHRISWSNRLAQFSSMHKLDIDSTDILELFGRGFTEIEISQKMGRDRNEVKSVIERAMKAAQVRTRGQLFEKISRFFDNNN